MSIMCVIEYWKKKKKTESFLIYSSLLEYQLLIATSVYSNGERREISTYGLGPKVFTFKVVI